MRIIGSILVLAGVLLAAAYALTASAGSPANVRTVPATLAVDFDDGPFEVRVELSNLDHQGAVGYDDDRDTTADRFESSIGLAAFEALFTFNSGLIEIVGVEPGDAFEGSVREPQCFEREPVLGQYTIGCVTFGPEPGPQGDALLATFTFRPLANGTTVLELNAQLSGPLGDSIDTTSASAAVSVSGAPRQAPPPTPTSSAPPATPGPNDPAPAGPSIIGGGTPGAPTTPVSPSSGPSAGTGYEPPDATLRPLIIGGSLAAVGFVLLAAGSRLALRRRS